MSLFIILLIITLIALILLLRGRAPAAVSETSEAQQLLTKYDADSQELDAATLAHRRYQLYQELAALRARQKNIAQTHLPKWSYALIILAILGAFSTWLYQDGITTLSTHSLFSRWQSKIDQVRFGNVNALDDIANQNLPVFCQLLQRKINRSDNIALSALGECYSKAGEALLAEPVYDRLHSQQPDNTQTTLLWAQTKIFAHPNQPVPDDVKAQLNALMAQKNLMATLLMAIAETRAENIKQAAALWQTLQTEMPHDHPLYALVERNAQATQAQLQQIASVHLTVHLQIPHDLIANLPASARLFVFASKPNQAMPIAVKALPLQAMQTLTLTDADSMQGESLASAKTIILRAKISADGTATGKALASAASASLSVQESAPITLALQP